MPLSDLDADMQIRLAAFDWLDRQAQHQLFSLSLTRKTLTEGFPWPPESHQVQDSPSSYGGKVALTDTHDDTKRIKMMAQHGIVTPELCTYPLTIATTATSPYEDSYDAQSGVLSYSYSSGKKRGVKHNLGLRHLMQLKRPLIYLYGLQPGKYLPIWPVWVVADDPDRGLFSLVIGDTDIMDDASKYNPETITARHRMRVTRQRLHQPVFRHRVLTAYDARCALCRLGHTPLLQACHIKPDSEGGSAHPSNGLAMCHLHHSAYDANLLGIHPDGNIAIPQAILDEQDGPTLKHSLIGLNGEKITKPKSRKDHPDKDHLAMRWERFEKANG
ncbi:MAG: HNH endonuclease [Gammaproteobacteria bacterium]